jgi:hypothetical protein
MPALLLYLLKANVALVLFYLVYYLVLRKLTFYHLNRLFLVFGIVFSAIYPLIDLTELFSRHEELTAMQSYAVVLPAWSPNAIPEQATAFDYWLIPVALFWLGCAFMVIRLLLQFVSLYKIHRASVPASYQGVDFRKVSGISEAFSFWKTIYLNPSQHRSPELESILRHEQIHVNGWHTLDVLLAELSTVFYWFNPGVWLMKKAMKENLEFIADQHVVDAGVDRKEYQYLLLKVVGATQPQIANQFNFPSLKRRIAMMNKMPTSKVTRLRLLVVLPITAALIIGFSGTAKTLEHEQIHEAGFEKRVTEINSIDDEFSEVGPGIFVKNSPEIKSVCWTYPTTLAIKLNSGEEDIFQLDDEESFKKASSTYGVWLKNETQVAMQSPTVPSPVIAQQESYIIKLQDIDYYQDKAKWPEDYKDFLKRHPHVKEVGWKFDNRRDYNLESIVIYLKNGKTETYDYNRNPRIPAAEAKWGQLPSLPPPPPPVKAQDSPQSDVKSNLPADALYFIDGVESTKQAAEKLDPKEINSINVYKGESALETFGNKASKGVISIITEKNKNTRQVQEFNKKLPVPPAPGTPPPPPAPGEPGIPSPPPAPAGEQLPPPPPPVKYEGPAIPKAGGARLVEDDDYVLYVLWPEEITKRELEGAQQAFKGSGFDLRFDEKYAGGKISGIKIELSYKNKNSNANAVYNTTSLQSLIDADNVVLVKGNKKTGEVMIGTTLANR